MNMEGRRSVAIHRQFRLLSPSFLQRQRFDSVDRQNLTVIRTSIYPFHLCFSLDNKCVAVKAFLSTNLPYG